MINHLMPTIPNIPKNTALYENNCTQYAVIHILTVTALTECNKNVLDIPVVIQQN